MNTYRTAPIFVGPSKLRGTVINHAAVEQVDVRTWESGQLTGSQTHVDRRRAEHVDVVTLEPGRVEEPGDLVFGLQGT